MQDSGGQAFLLKTDEQLEIVLILVGKLEGWVFMQTLLSFSSFKNLKHSLHFTQAPVCSQTLPHGTQLPTPGQGLLCASAVLGAVWSLGQAVSE